MKILFCGITGSIGNSFLKAINNNHKIVGFTYYSNEKLAKEISRKYKVKFYYTPNEDLSRTISDLDELINITKPDLIVNAVSGLDGLAYTLKAIDHKIDIALANKESLVMAGYFIKKLCKKHKINLLPIDSEHSSLMELFNSSNKKDIKKLYITCSGGSCYNKSKKDLENISFNEIIKHPNWSMGWKISFDSATLINKCFEIVEAYHLFQFKEIEALYHPQSIIHSLIEYKDNSVFANMSVPDMTLSVSLAINKFEKQQKSLIEPLDFTSIDLKLEKIDTNKWQPIKWAYEIINDKNNCLGIIINFANERAIDLFKNNKIKFKNFYSVIAYYIDKYRNFKVSQINDIYKLLSLMEKDNKFF